MFSVINFEELSATRLCEYIQRKLHAEIRVAVDVVKRYIFQDCGTQYTLHNYHQDILQFLSKI